MKGISRCRVASGVVLLLLGGVLMAPAWAKTVRATLPEMVKEADLIVLGRWHPTEPGIGKVEVVEVLQGRPEHAPLVVDNYQDPLSEGGQRLFFLRWVAPIGKYRMMNWLRQTLPLQHKEVVKTQIASLVSGAAPPVVPSTLQTFLRGDLPVPMVEGASAESLGIRWKAKFPPLTVASVRPSSVAAEAKLRPDDAVLSIEREAVDSPMQFRERLRGYAPFSRLALRVERPSASTGATHLTLWLAVPSGGAMEAAVRHDVKQDLWLDEDGHPFTGSLQTTFGVNWHENSSNSEGATEEVKYYNGRIWKRINRNGEGKITSTQQNGDGPLGEKRK